MRISLPTTLAVAVLLAPLCNADDASIERGSYLVSILGCGGCHTQGVLLGQQSGEWLAGSKIGIAYTEPEEGKSPGIVFPGNLTSDAETGLGRWSRADIVRMVQSGVNHEEVFVLPVMPWPSYGQLHKDDLGAIADYLMSLPPIRNQIPANSEPGQDGGAYVRIGVYLYDPNGNLVEQYGRPAIDED